MQCDDMIQFTRRLFQFLGRRNERKGAQSRCYCRDPSQMCWSCIWVEAEEGECRVQGLRYSSEESGPEGWWGHGSYGEEWSMMSPIAHCELGPVLK